MLSWLEINKDALISNLRTYQSRFKGRQIIPVIKANAYGLGAKQIIDIIHPHIDLAAVVSTREALVYKQMNHKLNLMVLTIVDPQDVSSSIRAGIQLTVYNHDIFNHIARLAGRLKKITKLHLKIDTGLHRIGFTPQQASLIIRQILTHPYLKLSGIFSHYACTDDPEFCRYQANLFETFIKQHIHQLTPDCLIHMAASDAAAAGLVPKYTNAIRPGIGLYGLLDPNNISKIPQLRPVLSFKAKIIHTVLVPKGDGIGYDLTYKFKRAGKLAVIPVGYSDGLPRALSNKGRVIISGQWAKIRGLVFMNAALVEVTGLENITIGCQATLLGTEGNKTVSIYDWSRLTNRSYYDLLTALNPNLPRIVKSDSKV